MNWQIEQSCPQCGAATTLAERDHLLTCAFCRTRLYLVPDGPFRYHIAPAAPRPGGGELLYFPYWRLRGASFSVKAAELTGRIADTSRIAVPAPGLPTSLGLRPQVLKLRFVNPETTGRFIAPDPPTPEAIPAPRSLPRGIFYRGFIGETLSLIYAPYFLRDATLFDGILGRPVATFPAGERERLRTAEPAGQVRFVPILCPHCGWDMEGRQDSLVLLCRNCDSAWHCPGQAFEPVSFSVLPPPPDGGEVTLFLPFWRMRACIEGIALDSRADLIRLANLPRAITAALEAAPLHFWSPAFKIHPALYARWSRQMTVFSPADDAAADRLPATPLHPVTLALAEAAEAIVLTIAQLIVDRRKGYPRLADLRVTLREARLEYHPFLACGTELRHPGMGVVLDRTALNFGSGL